MKLKLSVLIVVILMLRFINPSVVIANPFRTVSYEQAKNDLRKALEEIYGGSYSTIEMLLNDGMGDFEKLRLIPETTVNDRILKDLNGVYYPSFSTILMLYEENIKAYNNLYKKKRKKRDEGVLQKS